jgi:tetratricopeptide (TPR) repeat protein
MKNHKNYSSVSAACVIALAATSLQAAPLKEKVLREKAEAFATHQDERIRPLFTVLYLEGERNAVLNLNRLGLASLEIGDTETAARAFDAAIARIEKIYADNPGAKKARSLFSGEKVKDFKGEPYERAMTYFYRGLAYTNVGDFENARASFLAAEQQSMMGESEEYQGTFGLLSYLGAWASGCADDEARASELLDRAMTVQPQPFAGMGAATPHLLLADLGPGPVKIGTGQYSEKLSFRAVSEVPASVALVSASGPVGAAVIAADINWQAATRGGRPVDAILAGKAQWKANTTAASDAATTTGSYVALQGAMSGNSDLLNAGGVAMAAGLIGNLFSRAMTPNADVRTWAGLPAAIVLSPLPEPERVGQDHKFSLHPADGSASPAELAIQQRFGTAKCSVVWGRTLTSLSADASAIAKPDIQERSREAVNAQWRVFLEESFTGSTAAPGEQQVSQNASSGGEHR